MTDFLLRIKNKHLRRLVALAILATMTTWLWLMLRPLGYSYLEVSLGWIVLSLAISLAANRVRLWVEPWRRERRYKRLGLNRE